MAAKGTVLCKSNKSGFMVKYSKVKPVQAPSTLSKKANVKTTQMSTISAKKDKSTKTVAEFKDPTPNPVPKKATDLQMMPFMVNSTSTAQSKCNLSLMSGPSLRGLSLPKPMKSQKKVKTRTTKDISNTMVSSI